MNIGFAYRIHFPGNPIPLARPRLGKWGAYDSQKDLKKKTIECLMQQKGNWQKLDGPIGINFEFHMPLPKCSKKKQEEILKAYHIKKPDLSNMIKYYEDCLQGHLYDDDSQVVEILASKVNALLPQTVIHIWNEGYDDL